MQRKTFCSAFIAASVAAVLAGCSSAPQVRVDRAPGADLRSYKTFAFYDHPGTDGARYGSIVTQRLKTATRTQMEKLGYAYSEQSPQLMVNFLARVTDKQEIKATPGRFRYRGLGGGSIDTDSYKAGTLRIDLVDVQRQALAWQGVAEGRLSEDALKSPGAAVELAVAEIFARFPGAQAR
jgi:hypothetical protein